MGDRALIVFHNQEKTDFSPTAYLHWGGSEVAALLGEARQFQRNGDVAYACARFIGVCHAQSPGVLSLGVWNTPTTKVNGWRFWDKFYPVKPNKAKVISDLKAEGVAQERIEWAEREFDEILRETTRIDADATWEKLTNDDYSHGDAGVFLVNVDTWEALAFNGYGFNTDGDESANAMRLQLDATPAKEF